MFGLLSTLFRGINSTAVGASRLPVDRLGQNIRAAEAAENSTTRELGILIRQQRAEQTALNLLRSRQSALEDHVRQAMAEGSDDLATNGARALADLENDASVRLQTLARLDEKVARLRRLVANAHGRVSDLREGVSGDGAAGPDDPLPAGRPVAEIDASSTDASVEDGVDPATRIRAEDVLIRLRTTPAPTTRYLSP